MILCYGNARVRRIAISEGATRGDAALGTMEEAE
eukprot:COSAG05_NODE_10946_length_538_cov_0.699317_1_plen_33_part_10